MLRDLCSRRDWCRAHAPLTPWFFLKKLANISPQTHLSLERAESMRVLRSVRRPGCKCQRQFESARKFKLQSHGISFVVADVIHTRERCWQLLRGAAGALANADTARNEAQRCLSTGIME